MKVAATSWIVRGGGGATGPAAETGTRLGRRARGPEFDVFWTVALRAGQPEDSFPDDWVPSSLFSREDVARLVFAVADGLEATDAKVLQLTATALRGSSPEDAAAALAPGAFRGEVALRTALSSRPGEDWAEILVSVCADDVAADDAAALATEEAERAANAEVAASLADAERRRRSTSAPPSAAAALFPPPAPSPTNSAAGCAAHVAAVDLLIAASRVAERPLRDAPKLLGDADDHTSEAAAERLSEVSSLPASFFGPNFVPSTALDAIQIRRWVYATLAARGASDVDVVQLVCAACADAKLGDVAARVAPQCAGAHRSGRSESVILDALIAAVRANAILPAGFVNDNLVPSSCLGAAAANAAVSAAVLNPEVAAEDAFYAKREAEGRATNRRLSSAAADLERARRVEELENDGS
mmetsp:Transcript_20135/g.63351  ORF Transcript_20135/g.63351 Transcript_20135/m.63351 type:complete len:415 (+) Transcript_20135:599-1843(+)